MGDYLSDGMKSSDTIKDLINKCLTEQLSELELLKSMYPNNDEIILTDKNIIKDIMDFLENKTDYTPNHLDYTVNLVIEGMKFEICINLPTLYPDEEPDIYVRCYQLNRYQESAVNAELSNFVKNNYQKEVCLYTAISWLQDNIDSFSENQLLTEEKSHETNELENLDKNKFIRLWIYSHHIYNKKKREDIIKKAKELNLTGFCLPGKPGIICVEGIDSDCKDWWRYIKSMSWKRIVIRNTEIFECTNKEKYQKFVNFEEVVFKNPVSRSNKHSDMSGFYKFIEDCGLSYALNDVFGFGNEI